MFDADFDKAKVYINLVANIINFVSSLCFLVFVFGRTNSRIYKHPKLAYLVKIGLASLSLGCLWGALILADPPRPAVVQHVGMAFTFMWAAWFHYIEFVKPANATRAKPTKGKKKR